MKWTNLVTNRWLQRQGETWRWPVDYLPSIVNTSTILEPMMTKWLSGAEKILNCPFEYGHAVVSWSKHLAHGSRTYSEIMHRTHIQEEYMKPSTVIWRASPMFGWTITRKYSIRWYPMQGKCEPMSANDRNYAIASNANHSDGFWTTYFRRAASISPTFSSDRFESISVLYTIAVRHGKDLLLQIRNAEHDVCLDIGSGNSTSLHAQRCHGLRGNQGFMFTDDHQIRSGRYCLAALSTGQPVRKVTCIDRNDGITEQYWVHDKDVSSTSICMFDYYQLHIMSTLPERSNKSRDRRKLSDLQRGREIEYRYM